MGVELELPGISLIRKFRHGYGQSGIIPSALLH
jgi:hypothetical protein